MPEKSPNLPDQSSRERLLEQAEILDAMQAEKNDGRGIEYVRWIVADLRRGDLDKARANYRNQSDKFGSYPDILEYLIEIGVAEKSRWGKG